MVHYVFQVVYRLVVPLKKSNAMMKTPGCKSLFTIFLGALAEVSTLERLWQLMKIAEQDGWQSHERDLWRKWREYAEC